MVEPEKAHKRSEREKKNGPFKIEGDSPQGGSCTKLPIKQKNTENERQRAQSPGRVFKNLERRGCCNRDFRDLRPGPDGAKTNQYS